METPVLQFAVIFKDEFCESSSIVALFENIDFANIFADEMNKNTTTNGMKYIVENISK